MTKNPLTVSELRHLRGPLHLFVTYLAPVFLLLFLRFQLPIIFCDDAYISFKTAMNFAKGSGLCFNPNEPIYVVTSPLWVLLLSAFYFLTNNMFIVAKILGATFEILLALSIVHYSRRLPYGRIAGMFGAIFLITNPVYLLTSFSGMELSLFLLTFVLTAYFISEKRWMLAAAIGAVSVWVRLDGILVYGAAIGFMLWYERRQPARILIHVLPSLGILTGYFIFGRVFFETVLPMSFYRKALTMPAFLSPEWRTGVLVLGAQFIDAILGVSKAWYQSPTAFPILILLLAISAIVEIVKKASHLLPLWFITAVYVAVFMGSGSSYARYFPWYFVPVLPVIYLTCGIGLTSLFAILRKKSVFFHDDYVFHLATVLLALGWIVIAFNPIQRDVRNLTNSHRAREQVYASAGIWAGKHLDKGAVIAANEIGAIGYYLPPDKTIFDMFGLLRHKNDLRKSYIDLMKPKLPECIFTRAWFSYKDKIEAEFPNRYAWHRFADLEIGIRDDQNVRFEPRLSELKTVYQSLDPV